jgi:hypothetical protein
MAFQAVPRRRYPVRIFTSELILDGLLEPLGHLLDDLSDPSKTGLLLHQAQIRPVAANSDLRPFGLQQVTANKADFHLVYLTDADDREGLTLMQRSEPLIAYTSRFVIRGSFHMGGESRLRDFADSLTGTFLPASEATVYPLFQPSIDIPKRYPLLFINKRHVRLYHPADNAQAEA